MINLDSVNHNLSETPSLIKMGHDANYIMLHFLLLSQLHKATVSICNFALNFNIMVGIGCM